MNYNTETPSTAAQASQGRYDKVDYLTRSEMKRFGQDKKLGFWKRIILKLKGRAGSKIRLPRADKYPNTESRGQHNVYV